MKRSPGKKRTPRHERKREILRILYFWGTQPLTMSQIAFWLAGCQASNHLLKILHEMEAEKMVSSKRVPYRKNATKLLWEITDVGVIIALVIQDVEGVQYAVRVPGKASL